MSRLKISMETKIIRYLADSHGKCFKTLPEIYAGVRTEGYGEEAGVRGILNRNTHNLFVRGVKGQGQYRLTTEAKRCYKYFKRAA